MDIPHGLIICSTLVLTGFGLGLCLGLLLLDSLDLFTNQTGKAQLMSRT